MNEKQELIIVGILSVATTLVALLLAFRNVLELLA